MFMEMNSFITMPSCMDCLGKGTLRNACQNNGKFCHHYGEGKRWDASVESETSALCRQGELCEMCARIMGSESESSGLLG